VHEVDVQMGHLVTDGVEIRVLGSLSVLEQACDSAAGSTESRRFLLVQLANTPDIPLGLDDELAPIGGRPGAGMNVTHVDEVILEEHATLCCIPESVLVTNETTR
jgi:hypothetical protein